MNWRRVTIALLFVSTAAMANPFGHLSVLVPIDPDVSVTAAVLALGPALVDFDDERAFFNVNAPGDLARAARLLGALANRAKPKA